jgi:hypothetical protein
MTTSSSLRLCTWLFACFALGGCKPPGSGGADAGTGGAAARGGSSAPESGGCKKYKACDLLTIADINKALGTNLTTPGVETDMPDSFADRFGCRYASRTTVTLNAACLHDGGNNAARYAESRPQGNKSLGVPEPVVTTVPGIGEYAWWAVYPSKDRQLGDSYILVVFWGKGGNFNLVFSMPAGSKIDPLAAGKQMAETILARL